LVVGVVIVMDSNAPCAAGNSLYLPVIYR